MHYHVILYDLAHWDILDTNYIIEIGDVFPVAVINQKLLWL